jgi:hypothetical protein
MNEEETLQNFQINVNFCDINLAKISGTGSNRVNNRDKEHETTLSTYYDITRFVI